MTNCRGFNHLAEIDVFSRWAIEFIVMVFSEIFVRMIYDEFIFNFQKKDICMPFTWRCYSCNGEKVNFFLLTGQVINIYFVYNKLGDGYKWQPTNMEFASLLFWHSGGCSARPHGGQTASSWSWQRDKWACNLLRVIRLGWWRFLIKPRLWRVHSYIKTWLRKCEQNCFYKFTRIFTHLYSIFMIVKLWQSKRFCLKNISSWSRQLYSKLIWLSKSELHFCAILHNYSTGKIIQKN